jgi:hypothetical protein
MGHVDALSSGFMWVTTTGDSRSSVEVSYALLSSRKLPVKVVEHGRRFCQEESGRFQERYPEWQHIAFMPWLNMSSLIRALVIVP